MARSSSIRKAQLLFLCTGNSCRSQMAEGLARELLGDSIEAYSAGTEPHGLNQRAVQVMKEIGIDISTNISKSLESLSAISFDLVVTVCDNASKSCPLAPTGAKLRHVPFDDPPKLAQSAINEDGALSHYRRVRDEIKEFILTLSSDPIISRNGVAHAS